jgi:hypothetical protein
MCRMLRRPQGDGYSFATGGAGDGFGGNGSGGGTGGGELVWVETGSLAWTSR